MKILLTGTTGQVGYELQRSLQGLGELVVADRNRMNLADPASIRALIADVRPGLIVNPAAYTAVDKAESERELAMAINATAPAVMAEEAKKLGAALIHYSTDYVFDGTKEGAYVETDPTCPINVYGESKLAGEQAIAASGANHLILRTSWVYGMRGKNFLLTMLRLGAEREQLNVVADQFGAPTWARTIADTTAHIVSQQRAASDAQAWWDKHSGIYHLSGQGVTTWHGFTEAILRQAGLDAKCKALPIPASQYPTPARRPSNSAMSCDKLRNAFCDLPQWDQALTLCMQT
ncbi:MAG TPA: dTDP-4-dehydrorhamnose reductase [Burkholderiaceae bacterium]